MNKKLLHIITIFFITLLVSACGNEPCKRDCDENGKHCKTDCGSGNKECVEADDWGDPKIWVPAGEDDNPYDTHLEVRGDYSGGQVATPIDSGQILLNSNIFPLVMSIGKRNQWTSWFGGKDINPRGSDGKPDPYGWDAGRIVPNIECEYFVTHGASPGDIKDDLSPATIWQPLDNGIVDVSKDLFYMGVDNKYYSIPNKADHAGEPLYSNGKTPCYYRYGMGLYVGLAPDDGVGETTSDSVIFTYHIPDAKSPDVPDDQNIYFDKKSLTSKPIPAIPGESATDVEKAAYEDYIKSINSSSSISNDSTSSTRTANREKRGMDGYVVRGFAQEELPGSKPGDRLFFKILDSHYTDNEGGYLVRIREGTRSSKQGPLETVTGVFTDPIKIIMKRLYNGIVNNIEFVQFVRGLLVLYIVFYGFKFVMGVGSAEELRKDAVIRMLKIGVLVQLISPGSWTFFYDHLFGAFVEGVMGVAALLMSPFADYDPNAPWYSMDRLLAKFFSGETNAKISSTLFSNIWGFLIVPILYLAIILFVKALIKAVIIWVVGLIAIAMLVVMAPIFIIFILFQHTKELFDEWWKQMVAFGIQEIMLLASLGMFAAIIVLFMERTIGYTVCWSVWADFDFVGINETGPMWANFHLFDLRFWMPDISRDMTNIWMDANGDGVRGMQEFAYRYVDLPYFDPVYDKALIAKYMTERDFLEIGAILIFLVAILLMELFMDYIPDMISTLQGGIGSVDSASMFGAGGKLFGTAASVVRQTLVGEKGSLFSPTKGGLFGAAKGGWKSAKWGYNVREDKKEYRAAKRALLHGGGVAGGAVKGGAGPASGGAAGGFGARNISSLFGTARTLAKASGIYSGKVAGAIDGAEKTVTDAHSAVEYKVRNHLDGVQSRVEFGAKLAEKNVAEGIKNVKDMKNDVLRGLGVRDDAKKTTGQRPDLMSKSEIDKYTKGLGKTHGKDDDSLNKSKEEAAKKNEKDKADYLRRIALEADAKKAAAKQQADLQTKQQAETAALKATEEKARKDKEIEDERQRQVLLQAAALKAGEQADANNPTATAEGKNKGDSSKDKAPDVNNPTVAIEGKNRDTDKIMQKAMENTPAPSVESPPASVTGVETAQPAKDVGVFGVQKNKLEDTLKLNEQINKNLESNEKRTGANTDKKDSSSDKPSDQS